MLAAAAVFAEDEKYDNPGYFETPGWLAIMGSSVDARSAMRRDGDIRPYLTGTYNILQSEYGNLGLTAGLMYWEPSKRVRRGDNSFTLNARQYTGDIGLSYSTGSKTINYMIGLGYSYSYMDIELESVKYNGMKGAYSDSLTASTGGIYYFIGAEYMITKNGKWGLFAMYHGREVRTRKFDYDDGGLLRGSTGFNTSNQTFSFGLSYHF